MQNLSGANLLSYIIGIIKDVVGRNPTFTATLGQVTFSSNNSVYYRDTQITVRDIASSGNRLSPNYFLCNQYGRSLVAKLENSDGSFVEWIRETDRTGVNPPAGVYYLTVDSVSSEYQEIDFTLQKFSWVEGKVLNASGSVIYLNQNIDGTTLTVVDGESGQPVQVNALSTFINLQTPVQQVRLISPNGDLTPMVDFWYQRPYSAVLTESTVGGLEIVEIGNVWVSYTITDQDGYVLRRGQDYSIFGLNSIQLNQWTPQGSLLTIAGQIKADPSVTSAIHPENILNVGISTGDSLIPDQIQIRTPEANYMDTAPDLNGEITLPYLLQPGDWLFWEARVDAGQVFCRGKKRAINGFREITQSRSLVKDINGLYVDPLPGLLIAVGDSVNQGDQVAIIVSPETTETYEVYGSKENVSLLIDIRTNDLQTSSDLSEIILQALLVTKRQNMESDGITVFEASRSYRGQARDNSATAATFTYSVNVSLATDWEIYIPKVTRVARFEITSVAAMPDFKGKIQLGTKAKRFGGQRFIFNGWYS